MVDREQQAHGFFYRTWRRLALVGGITQRRSLLSLRQALEQEALLAYAAIAAGANAPKLIATSELGPDAVMLVYEHIGGRRLDALADEEITDALMRETWTQVRALQSRRLAHRRLVGQSLLVDRGSRVFLTDLRGGEIAAGDIVLRMDIAQLLTTLALRIGPERAVASALSVLGPDAVADSLPLLQPIALSRATRGQLKLLARARAQREREAVLAASAAEKEAREQKRAQEARDALDPAARVKILTKAERKAEDKAEKRAMENALDVVREEDLLSRIRQQVLLIRPQAPVEPVRLERIKPRTLITVIAGAFAAYFLLTQLSSVPFGYAISNADWRWALVAVIGSAASYFAAAGALSGFVPERLSLVRTVQAQVAGSFVKLVALTAVGGVALNTRYLQKAGVRPGLAVASVGASQLVGLGSHIVLLMTFGFITGTEKTPSLSPSRTVMAGLLTAGVLVLVVTAVPAAAEVRLDPGTGAVRGRRTAHAGRAPAAREAAHRHRRHPDGDGHLRGLPGRLRKGLRRAPELRGHRRGLPRGQRAGLGGAHPRRRRRGRTGPDRRSDRGRAAQGDRHARGALLPAADLLAAGAAGLAVLHPSDPQGRAVTARQPGRRAARV